MITLPMRAQLSHRERGRREMLSRPRLISFLVLLATPGLRTEPSRPQEPKTLFEEAQRALAAGDYASAEKGFREVLKLEPRSAAAYSGLGRSEEHTSELQSRLHLVCRLLLEKKKKKTRMKRAIIKQKK